MEFQNDRWLRKYALTSILLGQEIDVNNRMPYSVVPWGGQTPLLAAVKMELEDFTHELLQCNADVTVADSKGFSSVLIAEHRSQPALVKTLLMAQKFSRLNPVNKKLAFSHYCLACKYGLNDVVIALLHGAADAKLPEADSREQTPFLEVLMDFVEKPNPAHYIPPIHLNELSYFHIACRYGTTEIVKCFIDRGGVDLNEPLNSWLKRWERFAPLHFAVENGNADIIRLLLEHGAKTEVRDIEGWTPLHIATRYTDDTSIAEQLLDYGANVEVEGFPWWKHVTPLHTAIEYNRPNHVSLFIKRGANIHLESKFDLTTPLHKACRNLQVKVVKQLLDNGANPNVMSAWISPLQECVSVYGKYFGVSYDRCSWIIRHLVEAGADLNIRSRNFLRPIDVACENKDERPLRALLFYGADVRSPKIRWHRNNVDFLLEHLEILRFSHPSEAATTVDPIVQDMINRAIISKDKVARVQDACKRELKVLQGMDLHTCLTYSGIFRMNAVAVHLLHYRKEKLLELLEKEDEFRRQFPWYQDRLRRWYDDVQSVQSYLEPAVDIVRKHWNLNEYCAESLFRYLKANEVETMVKAFIF